MPDRVIRDELMESERWLSLPSDTDRLVYSPGLILRADDFGNLEGGQRRLFRWMQSFSQVKTEEGAAMVMLHLTEADLARRYEVQGREFYHLPRFRPHRQYLVRKVPKSPWDDERPLGKEQRVFERGLARNQQSADNVVTTSIPSSNDVAQGVGVGEGEVPLPRSKKPTAASAETWSAYAEAYRQRYGAEPTRNAKVNANLSRFVQRVGQAEAPAIASFYVGHNHRRYVERCHDVATMLQDAEGLRTQWQTGRRITSSAATQLDKQAGQREIFRDVIREHEEQEGKGGKKPD